MGDTMTNQLEDFRIRKQTIGSYLEHPDTPVWYKEKLRLEYVKIMIIEALHIENIEEATKPRYKTIWRITNND